ncbi:hypothetical protein AMECASPLE_016592 [Ameca splendens]|uniref:Uncharacterized protein n=1 Tax=Ameca splendens TaxID=208324 RepID=A0ABV0YD97_9TELE
MSGAMCHCQTASDSQNSDRMGALDGISSALQTWKGVVLWGFHVVQVAYMCGTLMVRGDTIHWFSVDAQRNVLVTAVGQFSALSAQTLDQAALNSKTGAFSEQGTHHA